MTTAKDLLIIAMDVEPNRPVGQGDLSLALAGAEVIDLLGAEALGLDGDRIVPTPQLTIDDHLLSEAASSLNHVRERGRWARGCDQRDAWLPASSMTP